MASPERYRSAMERAGFADITVTDRNPWYREVARAELPSDQLQAVQPISRASR